MSDDRKLFLHPPVSGGTYLSLGSPDHVWFEDEWIYETLEAAIDAWRSCARARRLVVASSVGS